MTCRPEYCLVLASLFLLPRSSFTFPRQMSPALVTNDTKNLVLDLDTPQYDLQDYSDGVEEHVSDYGGDEQVIDYDEYEMDEPEKESMEYPDKLPSLEVKLPIDVPPNDPPEPEPISEMETLHLRSPPRKAPEYMLDLYNMFSKEKFSHPSANIVRSYVNINDENHEIRGFPGTKQLTGKKARIHTLVFNVTSLQKDEEIKLAELRLYTLVVRDRNIYMGVDRKVSVLEVLDRQATNESEKYNIISEKHVYGHENIWEVFDVTSAVKRWNSNVNSVQILEVRIESVFAGVVDGDMDIDVDPVHQKDPLLVVFSNNIYTKEQHDIEVREMEKHEFDSGSQATTTTMSVTEETSFAPKLEKLLNSSSVILNRVKRGSKHNRFNRCRRKPMVVKFEKINLHNWILAPPEYHAYKCSGKCYRPMGDDLSPTKHAVIQTLMHAYSPRTHSRACCVPTRLDPISVLYYDEQGIITYKYKYDGMVVGACGCR